MAIRNSPEELGKALKQRAAKRNRSAELKHHKTLRAALDGPRRRPIAAVLTSMPNVGEDEDFVRKQSNRRR